jgi:hypothetical protein
MFSFLLITWVVTYHLCVLFVKKKKPLYRPTGYQNGSFFTISHAGYWTCWRSKATLIYHVNFVISLSTCLSAGQMFKLHTCINQSRSFPLACFGWSFFDFVVTSLLWIMGAVFACRNLSLLGTAQCKKRLAFSCQISDLILSLNSMIWVLSCKCWQSVAESVEVLLINRFSHLDM